MNGVVGFRHFFEYASKFHRMKPLLLGLFALLLTGIPGPVAAKEILPVYEGLGGEFSMDSTLGEPISLSQFKGQLVMVYFGYTSCPDICPLTLTVVKQAMRQLGESRGEVQMLFISVDQERDSVEQMKIYLEFFHPTFIGLHGELEQVRKVAKQFGAFFMKDTESLSSIGHLISHTGYVYLLDRQSRVRKLFRSDVEALEIVETVRLLLDS